MSDFRRLLPAVLFALGIALRPAAPSLCVRCLLAAAAALIALAAGVVRSRRRRDGSAARSARLLRGSAAALALLLAGGAAADLEDRRYEAPLRGLPADLALLPPEGRVLRVAGRFEEDPERAEGDRDRAMLRTESVEDHGRSAPFQARVQLTWPAPSGEASPPPLAGRAATTIAHLRLPRTFGNPGAFDMSEHLERRETTVMGWVKSARLIEAPDPPRPPPIRARVRRRYDAILQRIFGDGAGALSPAGSVLRASVLGGRTGLDAETERALVASGVYHILAVSGLQVALLASVALGLLRRTPVPPIAALGVAAALTLAYGAIVAPSPSVGRALTMALLAAAARLLRRRTPATAILGLAALARLAVHPSELGDPGFQLTFAATAGLLLIGPRLAPHVRARAGLGPLLVASLAAQAATWPLVALWFHRIVPYGLASNLLAVPLGSIAVVLGVLILPADLVHPRLADALGAAAGLAVHGLMAVARVQVEGTALSFRVPAPRPALLALATAATLALTLARTRRARGALAVILAMSFALVVFDPFPRDATPPWDGRTTEARTDYRAAPIAASKNSSLHARDRIDRADASTSRARTVPADPWVSGDAGALGVDLIDVGQGDAVLVRFDDGETMLVDGGGFPGSTFDVGARVLVPELERRGLLRIGRVVLTHAHEDHGGGLREVLRALRVGELIVPDSPQGPLRDELEVLARARGARVLRIRRGYEIREGNTVIRCLAPFPGVTDGPNADSLVLRVEAGGRAALLTGDIIAATERRLLARGIEPADVLKVAHHGSDSSSLEDFLGALRPRVALISVGDANRFGHPSARVLARLDAGRATVLRTDRDGAVRVDARGGEIFSGSLEEARPGAWPGPAQRPRRGPD